MIPLMNKYNLDKIIKKIPHNVQKNISGEFKFTNGQEEVYKKFDRKMWIHGQTRFGKSHLLARKLIEIMMNAKRAIKADWFEAKEIDMLFLQQYGERQDLRDYHNELERISKLDVLIINDIDKLSKDTKGKYSHHKSNQLWSLFDECIAPVKIIMVSANCSITKFCYTMSDDIIRDTLRSRLEVDIVPCEIGI
jgi:hypothetical protein